MAAGPAGWDPTPSSLGAALQLMGATANLLMFIDVRDRMKACADRAMEIGCEIDDKKCDLQDLQGELYAKLCDVPDVPDAYAMAANTMESGVSQEVGNTIDSLLQGMDCYDVGYGREAIRSTLAVGVQQAVMAQVDACNWNSILIEGRQIMQLNAVVGSPMTGDGYSSLGSVYRQVGTTLAAQSQGYAQAFNNNLSAFTFSVQMIRDARRRSRDADTRHSEPITTYPIIDRAPLAGFPVGPAYSDLF